MFENTKRAKVWYSEAVWTAASIFVQAANEDENFREDFMSEEPDKWRQTLREELPDLHEKVMGIHLSAFQGINAENVARKYLREYE